MARTLKLRKTLKEHGLQIKELEFTEDNVMKIQQDLTSFGSSCDFEILKLYLNQDKHLKLVAIDTSSNNRHVGFMLMNTSFNGKLHWHPTPDASSSKKKYKGFEPQFDDAQTDISQLYDVLYICSSGKSRGIALSLLIFAILESNGHVFVKVGQTFDEGITNPSVDSAHMIKNLNRLKFKSINVVTKEHKEVSGYHFYRNLAMTASEFDILNSHLAGRLSMKQDDKSHFDIFSVKEVDTVADLIVGSEHVENPEDLFDFHFKPADYLNESLLEQHYDEIPSALPEIVVPVDHPKHQSKPVVYHPVHHPVVHPDIHPDIQLHQAGRPASETTCAICGAYFPGRPDNYKRHMKVKHDQILIPQARAKPTGAHIQAVNQPTNLACPVCGVVIKYKPNLIRHMKKHNP